MGNRLKRNIGKFHKGGVIVEVKSLEEAKIAEEGGAVAVRIKELQDGTFEKGHIPFDIVEKIVGNCSISVITKMRTGHYVEGKILERLGVHFIEESECLEVIDVNSPFQKRSFSLPVISSFSHFQEAVRKLEEGSAILRTVEKNLKETVHSLKDLQRKVRQLSYMTEEDLYIESIKLGVSINILKEIKAYGRLPVAQFASGGIKTLADAALMMELGADGIIINHDIFSLPNPKEKVQMFVQVTAHFQDYQFITELSKEFQRKENIVEFTENWSEAEIT